MGLPVTPGHPDLHGGYIPRMYAMRLLVAFYSASTFAAISNTEYESIVSKHGDEVLIRTLPDITINDYTKGQKLEYENPEPGEVLLTIDRGKSWAFAINDVDKFQSDLQYVEKWAAHAGEQLKIAIDTEILGEVYSDVHADNAGLTAGAESGSYNLGVTGTPLAVDGANIVDTIVDCGSVLDEQNVPESDRFMVLPAWACGKIKKSDLQDASISGDGTSMLRNGRLGVIDRFTIYMSNNLSKVTDTVSCWNAIFGQKSALTFASQMKYQETLKNPYDFGDLFRALQVFGFKVVKPEALGHLYIKPNAEA